MWKFTLALGLTVLGGFTTLSPAALILSTYTGVSGGTWNVAGNWSPPGVPNNGANTYHAIINGVPANVNVLLNQIATIDQLTVNAGDSLTINNGQRLHIDGDNGGSAGTVNNAGTITVNSTGANTFFMPQDGPLTLTGGGTLILSDHPNNWIYRATFDLDGSFINVNNTIRGAGHLGSVGTPTAISNAGTIIANGVNPLWIATAGAGFTNTGTLRAENGGRLQLNSGPYTNTGGLIEALNNSFVDLYNGAQITGGTLDTTGTGLIRAFNGGGGSIADVANSGVISVVNSQILRLSGTINNTGTIEVNSTANATQLRPIGPVTLTGGGTIAFSDNVNNWIFRDDAAGALNNVDNTIQGAGHLGFISAPTPITNQGLVLANASNLLILTPGSETFTNSGTMRAENGARLLLESGAYANTGGLIEALDNSFVDLVSGAEITGGTLDTTGTGVVRVLWDGVGHPASGLNDLTSAGLIRIENGRELLLSGTINNTGAIEINATTSTAELLQIGGPVTLTGGGTITMSDVPPQDRNVISGEPNGLLINQDNTIQGAGVIGHSNAGAWMTFINHGTILANATKRVLIRAGFFSNTGTLHVSGAGGAHVSHPAPNFVNSGTVTIDAGCTLLFVNTLQHNGGVVQGNGTATGTVNNTGGTVRPGASAAGTLTIGNYTQAGGGTLDIEIGGATPGNQHDVLAVSGTAALSGTLKVTLINGFTPAVDQEFTVLTSSLRTGQFRALDAPLGFCIVYQGNNVKVKLEDDTCAADITCDGAVTVDDLLAVINTWGACSNTPCPPSCLSDIAPAAGNCLVNVDDLLLVINGWGACP